VNDAITITVFNLSPYI